MKETILNLLKELEQKENFRIVMAVEVYSRAWGIACPDTDYHIFLSFVRPPAAYQQKKEDSLPTNRKWDLLEGKVKIEGWDLNNVLKAFQKHNPTIFEWVNSPEVYRTCPVWERLKVISKQCYTDQGVIRHYYCHGKNYFRKKLTGEMVSPWITLVVLRDFLCTQYVWKNHAFPPISYQELLKKSLPKRKKLQAAVNDLLAQNQVARLPEKAERVPVLYEYLQGEVERQLPLKEAMPIKPIRHIELNHLFVQAITDLWK